MTDPKSVLLILERDADSRLQEYADLVHTSKSALAQFLIDHMELDERGLPVGWPDATLNQLQLPQEARIDAA